MDEDAPGPRLRRFREWRNQNKAKLATDLDISPVYVGYLERGERFAGTGVALRIREATEAWPDGPILPEEWARAKRAAAETQAEVA